MGGFGGWDVVAVTAETAREASAFQAELRQRRELGALPGVTKDTILLAVPDPHPRPEAPLRTDLVLSATGRTAVTTGMGLEELGISLRPNGDVCVGSDLMTEQVPTHASSLYLPHAISPMPSPCTSRNLPDDGAGTFAGPPTVE